MKIEKLGIGKIKVTVSHSELNTWNINPKSISPDSPQLKEFIGSMIARSAGETGIELSGSNVLVEARPQGEDFVFIITTVGNDTDKMKTEIIKTIKRQKLMSGQYKAATKIESKNSYFEFDTLPLFAEMLRCTGLSWLDTSVLYKGENGYLLSLDKQHPLYERTSLTISEYAKKLPDSASDAYVSEHAKPFASAKDFDTLMRCYL